MLDMMFSKIGYQEVIVVAVVYCVIFWGRKIWAVVSRFFLGPH